MEISVFTPKNEFGCNTYLLSEGGAYAVIDASVSWKDIAEQHPECKGKIAFVLLTHAHFDHILSLGSYIDAKIPVYLSEPDVPLLSDPRLNCSFGRRISYDFAPDLLTDGQTLSFGGTCVSVQKTPGHTAGSAVFLIGDSLFTGDTVFADGSYGRCDLPGGDIHALRASLESLTAQDPSLTVYPGHGKPDTLGRTLSLIFQ